MTVRRNQLICDVIDGEEVLQSGQCLVVESLELWFETFDCELLMNAVIFFDPSRGRPCPHGNDFDIVAIIDVKDHHIRVSFAGSHRELSRQVGAELTLIDYDCVHEVVFVPKSVSGDSCFSIGAFEVDSMFWRRWFIWHMAVARVSFKCLLIVSSIKRGQVIRFPSLTACYIADFVGLNKALCK
jgi:hypothetical protein